MGTSWGDLAEGVRVEVPNTDSGLPMKVYWIAGVIKLAGNKAAPENPLHSKMHLVGLLDDGVLSLHSLFSSNSVYT